MKFSETVMLGGSCLSAGVVLNGKSDVTVLERGATIGGEYFDTYCPVSPMDQKVRYEPVRQLQEALRERGALNDPYALAPLLYRALVPHTSRFHLYLEILEVRRVGAEWEVVYCDAGGVDSIRCRRVIDTTPECRLFPESARRFLRGQFLSAEIYTENPDAFFQWEGSGLVFHRGREFNELYFSCDFPPGVSPAEMRRILFQRWAERPAGLREGRIRSIGKRVGFRMACPAAKLGENLYWVDPVRFPNPLAALDNADVSLEDAEECLVALSSRAEPENPAAVLLYSELKNRTCVRSRKPVSFDFCTDLLVAGLGSGGSLAAVTAAEHGIVVAAVEKLPLAGGTGTAGGVTAYYFDYPGGAFESVDAECNAIRAEHFEPSHRYNADMKGMVIESRILKNGGRILYDSSVIGCWLEEDGRTVRGVRVASPDGVIDIGCAVLIDATGNGDLAAMLGAEFREGREFDGRCQPFSSVRFTAKGSGTTFANFDAGYICMSDPESITSGIISSNALHTLSPQEKQEPILWLTQVPGAREGRLPVCERTITFHDVVSHRTSDCKVLTWAYSNFDDHSQDWAFADPETCDWMVVASLWGKRFSVPLPLEILLVKGFANFITAGRAVSVDHTMASHLRMQRSIQKLGEIAALAAAQSIKTGLPLRKINLDLLEAEVRKSGTLDETCLIPNEEPSDPAALRALLEGEAPGEAIWVTGHEPEKYAGLLHEMLRNGTEHARRNAALALGLAGDPAARPILREIVASRDDFLPKMTKNPRQNRSRYLAAIHLLGRFGNPDDLRFLMELLESFPEDEQVFSHALRSALALGDLLPEQREMIRKRLDEIFHDSRFRYRLQMKNSSSTGEQVFHELNSDLRAMAEKHFRRWTDGRGDVA